MGMCVCEREIERAHTCRWLSCSSFLWCILTTWSLCTRKMSMRRDSFICMAPLYLNHSVWLIRMCGIICIHVHIRLYKYVYIYVYTCIYINRLSVTHSYVRRKFFFCATLSTTLHLRAHTMYVRVNESERERDVCVYTHTNTHTHT